MLQLDQVTSAPRATRVSMRTAVWIAVKELEPHPTIINSGATRTHVKATSNASTLQGLVSSILAADSHETGHLNLGELNLTATEGSQRLSRKLLVSYKSKNKSKVTKGSGGRHIRYRRP